MCRLTVTIDGDPVTKCDVGGESQQPDEGDRVKAAFSDALKRAAVKFGIGRYLYRLPSQWLDYDSAKKSFTQTPRLPEWACLRRTANPPRGRKLHRNQRQSRSSTTQPTRPWRCEKA